MIRIIQALYNSIFDRPDINQQLAKLRQTGATYRESESIRRSFNSLPREDREVYSKLLTILYEANPTLAQLNKCLKYIFEFNNFMWIGDLEQLAQAFNILIKTDLQGTDHIRYFGEAALSAKLKNTVFIAEVSPDITTASESQLPTITGHLKNDDVDLVELANDLVSMLNTGFKLNEVDPVLFPWARYQMRAAS